MGLFAKVLERRDIPLNDDKAWDSSLWNINGSISHSGVAVNNYTALNMGAVFNAITLISRGIASLPLHLYKQNGNMNTIQSQHPLDFCLHKKSNDYITAMTLREVMMGHILSWGNGFAEKIYDPAGKVIKLFPITPNRVNINFDKGQLIYEVQAGSEIVKVDRNKILHIAGLGFNGITGYSVISKARESIGLGLSMEEFAARYFGSGAHPGLVAVHPQTLTEKARKNITESMEAKYTGLSQAHKIMLLEEGMTVTEVGIPPDDSQFLESRQFSIPEIARWFNVPPHKLKDLSRATFSNIEHQAIEYLIDSILPWLVCLEQNYDMQLLTDEEINQGYYFKHIFEGLLRGDSVTRAEYYNKMWQLGGLSINEIREKENMNPITGGDVYFVPMNFIKLEDIGKTTIIDDNKNEEDIEEDKLRESRTIQSRNKIAESYYRLFQTSAQKIINKETIAISRNIKKYVETNDIQGFNIWLIDFYNKMPEYIYNSMSPIILSYFESIENEIKFEININKENKSEIEIFAKEYCNVYINNYIKSSIRQINKIIDRNENIISDINNKMNDWNEKRADRIALKETIEGNGAISKYLYKISGIKFIKWIYQGSETNQYCKSMNNKIIGIDSFYFMKGDKYKPEGVDNPLLIKHKISHPPLMPGCTCTIIAEK